MRMEMLALRGLYGKGLRGVYASAAALRFTKITSALSRLGSKHKKSIILTLFYLISTMGLGRQEN